MRRLLLVIASAALASSTAASQSQAPSLPLGAGRPDTPGITRTVLKDDPQVTVTRVRFEPNAAEPPHTHPMDVILVPVVTGPVEIAIGDAKLAAIKAGEVQFVLRNVTHHVKNTGSQPFELIAIAIK